ncbi:MAG: hypothetical protein FJ009_04570 [Chloroflexi bacterium]|nr:hypothetical protein [Chloroflexota bacterium]
MKRSEIAIIAAILLLAAGLRVYRLDQLPPGLHYDEAFNATMAHRVLTGIERPIFFTEDLTEEPMAIYVTALAFGVLGETTFTIRLVSALAGIATVAALYALARALFPPSPAERGRAGVGVSLLAAFTLAILYWHVNFSRLGMEPIFTPLMLTLAFAFLWRAISGQRSAVSAILSGIFFAATLYTYKAALFVPILFTAFIGLEVLLDRKFWAQNGRGLVILVGVAILVFAPLGIYLGTHPEQFWERPSTVASPSVATIADNAIKVAEMFFLRGDENPRSNLPGRPALDPFLAIGFVVGIIACLARIRQRASRLLLLWLGVMSLPSVLTDFAPHFGRNIAATPAIALITAFGFATILRKIDRRPTTDDGSATTGDKRSLTDDRWRLSTVYCLLLTGLAFSAFSTARDYFAIWGARTGSFDSFDAGYLTLAQKLRDRPASETIYLSPVDAQHYTIQFGLARRVAHSFDGRHALVLAPPGASATYGIVTRDDPRSLARLRAIFPDARVIETLGDYTGSAYATIVRVEGAAKIAPQKIVNARLGAGIELMGYDLARAGDAITLIVYWSCLAETRENYTVFAHLVGAQGLVAQDDTQPGRGSSPTARWQIGQVIADEHRLNVAALPRGEYQIEIGMYHLETGARVRVRDANGAPMESDRVVFERITVP